LVAFAAACTLLDLDRSRKLKHDRSHVRDADSVLKLSKHHALQLIVAQAATTITCLENMFAYAMIQASFVGVFALSSSTSESVMCWRTLSSSDPQIVRMDLSQEPSLSRSYKTPHRQ
jgi:hypothetical protein